MDLALLLKLAAPPVSISVAVQNVVFMLAIEVVGKLCYLLIENFIGVGPDLACVNVYCGEGRTLFLLLKMAVRFYSGAPSVNTTGQPLRNLTQHFPTSVGTDNLILRIHACCAQLTAVKTGYPLTSN